MFKVWGVSSLQCVSIDPFYWKISIICGNFSKIIHSIFATSCNMSDFI